MDALSLIHILFICEGMYAEKEKLNKAKQYKHMTFYEAADMAKRAEVKELWLTHFSPSLVRAEAVSYTHLLSV